MQNLQNFAALARSLGATFVAAAFIFQIYTAISGFAALTLPKHFLRLSGQPWPPRGRETFKNERRLFGLHFPEGNLAFGYCSTWPSGRIFLDVEKSYFLLMEHHV